MLCAGTAAPLRGIFSLAKGFDIQSKSVKVDLLTDSLALKRLSGDCSVAVLDHRWGPCTAGTAWQRAQHFEVRYSAATAEGLGAGEAVQYV